MKNLLHREPGFYRRLWSLALPLVLQNLITTSLGFVDTFMVGRLGNEPMAAVTAANSPIFLVQVLIFGLISGLTVLVSQYWGQGDVDAINRSMGIALYLGVLLSTAIALLLFFAPRTVLGLVTDNGTLVTLGAPYLRIVGFSYIFNSVSSVYVGMQRSAEDSRFGLLVFTASMCLNTGLNYVLIFGHFGAPALGITGAAIATLLSRVLEFGIVLVYALANRRVPLHFRSLFFPGAAMLRRFITYSTPVVFNESMWGLGTAALTAIMGHMSISTEMLAAYAIMGNIDKFSTVACFGLSGATAVFVGKRIGEGADREDVYRLSVCLLLVAVLVGFAISALLAILLPTFFLPVLYPLFRLSGTATAIAVTMCVVYVFTMPMRSFDISNIIGVLRAGGDARVASAIDLAPLWLVAIPLTALTALVCNAPIALICLSIQAENLCKLPLGLFRLRSRKWIRDVTAEVNA